MAVENELRKMYGFSIREAPKELGFLVFARISFLYFFFVFLISEKYFVSQIQKPPQSLSLSLSVSESLCKL